MICTTFLILYIYFFNFVNGNIYMSIYNFDKIIDRRGTNAIKIDALKERFGQSDLIPLWVADMDFETPQFITDALKERLSHSLFGYTTEPLELWPTIIKWNKKHHHWDIKQEWLTYIPGIVKGIGMVINSLLNMDDKVIIQPPVYHPFRLTTLGNHRQVVNNPLILNDDQTYSMDFENLEKVADDKCRLLILANPHNPAGVMWDKETLTRLAHFCCQRNILVISDEIHCDMPLWGNKHIPFATVSKEAADCSITFASPSKTFNIAGIVSSYAIVSNEEIRSKFYGWLGANELNEPDIFAPIATIAAFEKGEEWRQAMLQYVQDNIDFVIDYCAKYIPKIKPYRPDASYLVWMDCRELQLSQPDLVALFVKKAHLALNDGEMFGEEGRGFMRLNVGCPRSVLQQALDQLRGAINS